MEERGRPRGRFRPREWFPAPNHAAGDPGYEAATALGSLDAYVDGSGTIAENMAGIGVVLTADCIVVAEAAVCIGHGTNNRAELRAIGHAIGVAWRFVAPGKGKGKGNGPRAPLTIHSDSEFALAAASPLCTYNIHDTELRSLAEDVRRALLAYGPVALVHTKGHRRLPGVDMADELAIRGNNRADELASIGRKLGIARAKAEAALDRTTTEERPAPQE